jgi:hypothetical protein
MHSKGIALYSTVISARLERSQATNVPSALQACSYDFPAFLQEGK